MSSPTGIPAASRVGPSYAAALAAAMVLYGATLAPGPLWQDNGLAQVRVLQRDLRGDLGLALSHPLYYALGIAMQALPFAESAFKTNLVSAVFGAITVANVFLLLRLWTGHARAAVIGATALAVAHTFWQHCTLAEVYTVSTALLTTELLCLLRYERTRRPAWLILLLLANGLGVSNHMLAALNLPCYGVMVLWLARRRQVRPGLLPALALAWIAGASLYLGLCIAQIGGGAGLLATARSALFGETYARNVLNIVPGRRQLVNSALYLVLNFPTPVLLLAWPGAASLRAAEDRLPRRMLAVLLAVHVLWAVRYNVPDQYTFFLPAIVLLGVVIGLGADRFLQRRDGRWAIAMTAGAVLPALLYVPLPTAARAMKLDIGATRELPYRETYSFFLHPWKTGYRGAERFAREVHDTLPEGSLLIADSTAVRPLHYRQLTGQWRRRVRVWPPPHAGEGVGPLREADLRPELAAGRVYVVSPRPGYCPPWLLAHYEFEEAWPVYRVREQDEARPVDHPAGTR